MAQPRLQLRRGTQSPVAAGVTTALSGEPFFDTSNDNLWIADGASSFVHIGGKTYTARIDEFLVAATTNNSGNLVLREALSNGSNSVTIKAPDALASSYTLTLPPDNGTSDNQFLQTDGDGNLSWVTATINAFKTISVAGQPDLVADDDVDTLTLVEGEGIDITTDANADSVTISAELATSTNAGVASFSSNNFDVSAQGLVTIKASGIILGTNTSGQYASTITGGSGISATTPNADDSTAYTIDLDINELTLESSLADTDTFAFYDVSTSSNKKATADNIRDYVLGGVSGDILIDASGVATVQPNSVELGTDTTGNYVQSIATGADGGLTGGAVGSEGTILDLKLKNSSSFSNNTLLKWDDANNQLTNSLITDDGSTVVIGGNLTVTGATTTVSTTNTTISDRLLELANGVTGTPGITDDAGLIIERGTQPNIFIGYDEGDDLFVAGTTIATGTSNHIDPTPITFLAGAFNVSDSAGTNEAVISYLASGALYTGSVAGRYLQNINVDFGTY